MFDTVFSSFSLLCPYRIILISGVLSFLVRDSEYIYSILCLKDWLHCCYTNKRHDLWHEVPHRLSLSYTIYMVRLYADKNHLS
jgi:hypothetical protein